MIRCIRTDSGDKAFQNLVSGLDADLSRRDGNEHSFYAQFNHIDKIKYAVVAYEEDIPAGCGAIKEYDEDTMEIKRMYVLPAKRGLGIASAILKELEQWSAELRHGKCLLETGKRQPEAIKLYLKNGYNRVPNFGQYQHVENSLCFEKLLAGAD